MCEKKKTGKILHERLDFFCSMCSLHGLVYLRSNVHLSVCDRLFWATVVISSLLLSCVIIYVVWHNWATNPFVIVYDSNVRPIWDIPFPSVTICSLIAVKRSFLDISKTSDRKALFFSSLICASQEFFSNKNLSVRPEEMEEFYKFINKATPSCEEMIRRCYWRDMEFPCCKIFFPIITSLGRCYVINSLPSEMLFSNQTDKIFLFNNSYPQETRYWSPENGYPRPDRRGEDNDFTFPSWVESSGYEGGLSVVLEQNMEEWQDVCSGGYSGFKLLLNSPEEAPIISQAALRVPMKRDFLVELAPRTIQTDPSLASTHAKLRGCLFQRERNLRHFGTYTQNNCMLECLLETALELCKCVPFYMPRNSSVPVCSKDTDQECFRQTSDLLVARSMAQNYLDADLATPWCGCYPSCNEIMYNFVTNYGFFFKNATSSDMNSSESYGKVSIYYSDSHFLGVHRQADTTFSDFLGTCGGLLGLFMGFSCVSAVEILYHLVLRPLGCLVLTKRMTKQTTPTTTTTMRPLQGHTYYIKSYYY